MLVLGSFRDLNLGSLIKTNPAGDSSLTTRPESLSHRLILAPEND